MPSSPPFWQFAGNHWFSLVYRSMAYICILILTWHSPHVHIYLQISYFYKDSNHVGSDHPTAVPTSQVTLVVKNLPANAGDARDVCLIPGSGRSGGGHGNPLQDSCLENPTDRRDWQATDHGVTKSWTRLSMQHYFSPTSSWLNWLHFQGPCFQTRPRSEVLRIVTSTWVFLIHNLTHNSSSLTESKR